MVMHIDPVTITLIIRAFQACARALPAPTDKSSAMYTFLFKLAQELADNRDRQTEKAPVTGSLPTAHI